MTEKHISLNLDDEKTKQVVEALSNKSCKKILEFLTEKEASESKISEELEMAKNTVNYNIGKLKESGLIEEKDYFWSDKNRRIPVYGVANKKIVISPNKFTDKLKSLSVVLISAIFTAFILIYNKMSTSHSARKVTGASEALEASKGTITQNATEFLGLGIISWFLILVWIGIIIFVVINVRRDK